VLAARSRCTCSSVRSCTPSSQTWLAMAKKTLCIEEVFGTDPLDGVIIQFLRLSELLAWECSCCSFREVLLAGATWGQCVCREVLPQFGMPAPPATNRRDICTVVTHLRLAGVALGSDPITLHSFGVARALAEAIACAQKAKACSSARRSSFAEIVVARFRFDAGASTWHIGSSVVAIVGPDGNLKVWELTLAWQAGAMAMRLQCLGSDDPPDVDPGIMLDLHAVSDHVVLHLRDLRLRAGSPWVRLRDSVVAPSQRRVMQAELEDGLLCVLLVRDAPNTRLPAKHGRKDRKANSGVSHRLA